MSKQEIQKAIQTLKDHDFKGLVKEASAAYIAVFYRPQKNLEVYLDHWTIDEEKILMSICSYWLRGDMDSETVDVAITVDDLFDLDTLTKRWEEEKKEAQERARRIKEVEDFLYEAKKARTGLLDLSKSEFIQTDLTTSLESCNDLIASLEKKLVGIRGF